ncbi:trehalose-6-phosphate synthase [Lonsdalea britannica]|uniref:alpha,alpha-trehalose-phosphate synthase (UDP-forming) n=1 Tax=Lonsdalea britannica TaxID=1082704 RepID=UPI000A1F712D|nr:trehalose-6-phosphate synthase [Lonsdalea britannica]OSN03378.1 trehalose-6-phosphate synthase [Lonsdalea britannica]
MNRLVVVSNRVPPALDDCPAGGLASGMMAALELSGGVWFGWNGEVETCPTRVEQRTVNNVTFATTALTAEEYQQYYCGFSNGTLWPTFHYRVDLARYDNEEYQGYLRVNRRLAQMLKPLLRPDDIIWVQDYHLLPFAQACRAIGINNRIGFFLHIPFPSTVIATTIPPHRELFSSMTDYDLLGFQTEEDHQAFLDYASRMGMSDDIVKSGVYPISVAIEPLRQLAQDNSPDLHLLDQVSRHLGRKAIFSVDRLDYSKGLPERFSAYELLLKHYPEHRRRVQFVQFAPTTRDDISSYRQIRDQLDALAGRINGGYSELDWLALNYINKNCDRRRLMGLYRQAHVACVTPLRDGMNLVAKEYVAVQEETDPGVLVLSCFAGAARELDAALIVNPYDPREVAAALDRALMMPLEERVERHQSMLNILRHASIDVWLRRFVDDLSRQRPAGDAGRVPCVCLRA